MFSAFVSSERFFKATVISFSVKSVASVPAHWKVYSCVVCGLEAGLTVMPASAGISILLPPTEVTTIVPVEILELTVCTR